MIRIIPKGSNEDIGRMLGRLKKKTRKLSLVKKVRNNRYFKKPSDLAREKRQKAINTNQYRLEHS